MRILFLSGWFPYPPSNGSKLRIYNLLRGLSQQHEVSLLTFADDQVQGPPPPELACLCRVANVLPRRSYHPDSFRALIGLFGLTPRAVADTYVPAMEQHIRHELQIRNYDLVIASQWDTAVYWSAFGRVPAIFEELELGTLEAKREMARTPLTRLRHQLPLLKLHYYLPRLLSHFGACTVVSENEARLAQRYAANYSSLGVIPNGVNLADYTGIHGVSRSRTLIFTGSFRYFANHDAMVWFLSETYPLIQAEVPDVRLLITGDHLNLPLPTVQNVTLTGLVDDIRPLLASAEVSVAPIRLGGGTRLKILEAFALSTPVVATSKGAEGLGVRDGEHLLIADTPDAFAEAVVCLLRQPELRERLAANAHRLIAEKYDWAAIMPRFLELVERVART